MDIQAAQADLGTTQRTVAIRTGSAYYGFWTARERLRLGLERVRLAQQLEDIARKRLCQRGDRCQRVPVGATGKRSRIVGAGDLLIG